MKRLFLALLVVVFLASCAMVPQVIQNPVCPAEDSWICEQSKKLGIQPEEVYGYLYDAVAIAAITDAVKLKDVCEYEQQVADWYVMVYPLSYTTMITGMVGMTTSMDKEDAMLISGILNKRLAFYASHEFIRPADDAIFKKAHVAFQSDFGCK